MEEKNNKIPNESEQEHKSIDLVKAEETLKQAGLSIPESRVYLALSKLQEAKTGKLCKTSNIPSSNIYKILDSLIKKGLASYRVQNNIKIFMPSPPEVINELFNKSKDEIQSLILSLKKRVLEKEPYSNYKYYERLIGIKSIWYEIENIMKTLDKKEIIKIYSAPKEYYESLIALYTKHHQLRDKLKIKEQIIFHQENISHARARLKFKFLEAKTLDLKNEAEWIVIGDIFIIQYVSEKISRGFVIKDPIFAQVFSQTFDQLWKIAKPIK